MRLATTLLTILLFVAVQSSRAQQEHLRRSLLFHEEAQVDCLYLRGDIALESGENEMVDACQVEGVIYNLPVGLLDDYRPQLHNGKTRVNILGARLRTSAGVDEANLVILSRRTPQISIYTDPIQTQRSDSQQVRTTGDIKVISVRVTSKDAQVSLSKEELSNGMFGGNGNDVSFSSQMHACSAGALTILPGIQGGVGELYIDVNTTGVYVTNTVHSNVWKRSQF